MSRSSCLAGWPIGRGMRDRPARSPIPIGLIAAALVSSAGLPAVAAGQGVFESRDDVYNFAGVDFPSVVGDFAVLQVVRYPQVELGVVLRYSSPVDPVARFDLYVYPVPDGTGPDDAAQAEAAQAWADIQSFAGQNPQRFEVLSEEVDSVTVVGDGGASHTGWRVRASVRENGIAQQSLLYVFVKQGSYFKYRMSHRAGGDAAMEPQVEGFVRETLEAVSAGR